MLKLTCFPIEVGTTFSIRNGWRTQIAKFLKKDEECYPFNFKVVEIKADKFVCESVPDGKSKKKYMIEVTADVIRYLSASECPDSNVGLYFSDYWPLEFSKILVLNPKNQTIIPGKLYLRIEYDGEIPFIYFDLLDMLNGGLHPITTLSKCSWKMLSGPDTYMTDIERMYQDTFIHKDYVMMVCSKFTEWLKTQGLEDDAKALMERAIVHDASKIENKDEFRALTSIVNDKSCLKNASSQLSIFKQDSIELHWKHNRHHPEHFSNCEEMNRIDRMEMVCDWMARSIQYKSNLLEFVETRQAERFHFPELMYDEIYHWCKVLVSLFS